MKSFPGRFVFASLLYLSVLCVYAVFSFSLTDPNLTILTWPPYWQFQTWMWRTFFDHQVLLAKVFVGLILALFAGYGWWISQLQQLTKKKAAWIPIAVLVFCLPLFFSYNALSHDVFNYMFNAKMVWKYQLNPHEHVALTFIGQEPWLRFMHNVHTTAPYGYGWTGFSILPSYLGADKFLSTWLIFRGLSVAAVMLLGLIIWRNSKDRFAWATVMANPLLLIELISNSHNDLWMMVPALAALLITRSLGRQKKLWQKVGWSIIAALLLIFSASTKLATILLVPIWMAIWIEQMRELPFPAWLLSLCARISQYWAELSALLLFAPLLTSRAQQFHPWYLTWLLVWLPWIKWPWLKRAILALSLSSMLRYVPWLWNGGFSEQIIVQQKVISLGGGLLLFSLWSLGLLLWQLWRRHQNSNKV